MSLRTRGDNVLHQRELDTEWIDDYFNEFGCCRICLEPKEEAHRGLQRDVYYDGKYYGCVCFDCRCTRCTWYDNGRCLRKEVSL